MSTKFKVGDVVRIVSGSHHYPSITSQTFTIEKQHAGNGNLRVGDKWYKPWGHEARIDTWGVGSSLVLDGSPECKEIMDRIRRDNAAGFLERTRWRELPDEILLDIWRKVRAHERAEDLKKAALAETKHPAAKEEQ